MAAALFAIVTERATASPSAVHGALLLLGSIAALLGLFFAAVVAYAFLRRRRREKQTRRVADRGGDPWHEAGRRAVPFDGNDT